MTGKVFLPPITSAELLACPIMQLLSEHPNSRLAGPIRFFEWVALDQDDEAGWLRSFLLDDERDAFDHGNIRRVHNAFQHWTERLLATKKWKISTVRTMRDKTLEMFNDLQQSDPSQFPQIEAALLFMGTPTGVENRKSLGELDWGEFLNVDPSDRDRVGIALLRAEYLRVFEEFERVFKFGQNFLADAGTSSPSEERKVLASVLEEEMQSWSETGRSRFSITWPEDLSLRMQFLCDAEVWKRLGLESPLLPRGCLAGAARLLVAMLGPTPAACRAVQGIFCCDTGWNPAPIQELSLNPYAFQTGSKLRVGSSRVMAAFKARAGHFVFAEPGNARRVRGVEAENLTSIWDDIARSERLDKQDEQATLSSDGELVDILERLKAMHSNLRNWYTDATRDRMFACINHRGETVQLSTRALRNMPLSEVASRKGATYSAIRKSFFNTLSNAGFEPRLISELGGQRSSSVLQTNYIVGSQAVRTYEEPIRFFQKCLQMLSLSENWALRLCIPEEDRQWFLMLAELTGIASACSMVPNIASGETNDDFVFPPTRANLLYLALAHRGLKDQRLKVPRQRWNVQGTAALGLVKAIGRQVMKSGLAREYRAAARLANEQLRTGALTLPLLLEL